MLRGSFILLSDYRRGGPIIITINFVLKSKKATAKSNFYILFALAYSLFLLFYCSYTWFTISCTLAGKKYKCAILRVYIETTFTSEYLYI